MASNRQKQPARAVAPRPSSDCTLHFVPRGQKQPLYRPAALRRSSPAPSPRSPTAATNSPPASPALSVVEAKSSGWLSGLPWSPAGEREFRFDVQPTGPVQGTMLPRSLWRPDEEALICADADCKVRFGLIDRKHHCRRCGQIFCAAHSSRNSPLWPHPTEPLSTPPTPKATPRSTPRSSHVDIPSLAYTHTSPVSSAFSSISTSGGSSSSSGIAATTTPTSSPPKQGPSFLHAVMVRVCDTCYFAAPTPPMLTPPLAAFGAPRPLNLRHPHASAPASSSSGSTSFSQSPPRTQRQREKSGSRSRRGSVSGSSSFGTNASSSTTPPTSLDTHAGGRRSRGVSPATSLRAAQSAMAKRTTIYDEPREVPEEDSDDDAETTEEETEEAEKEQEQEEGAPSRLLKRETAFGSVKGAWQSWATF